MKNPNILEDKSILNNTDILKNPNILKDKSIPKIPNILNNTDTLLKYKSILKIPNILNNTDTLLKNKSILENKRIFNHRDILVTRAPKYTYTQQPIIPSQASKKKGKRKPMYKEHRSQFPKRHHLCSGEKNIHTHTLPHTHTRNTRNTKGTPGPSQKPKAKPSQPNSMVKFFLPPLPLPAFPFRFVQVVVINSRNPVREKGWKGKGKKKTYVSKADQINAQQKPRAQS